MAVSGNKTRVQISFSNELLKKLDDYCEETGMNRSSFVSNCVAEQLRTRVSVEQGMLEIAERLMRETADENRSEK